MQTRLGAAAPLPACPSRTAVQQARHGRRRSTVFRSGNSAGGRGDDVMTDAPRPGAAMVEFDSVGLRYGPDTETLSDISFNLQPGSFYFLTGASGAGKTSLLKLLYLAQRPSRGIIRLFGEDLVTMPRHRLPGFRRRIGVVFQDFRLIPHLSARDNIALPLRIAGVSEEDLSGPVGEMLSWIGLADRADAHPATLSGGEQQRVAIARAVIARPQLLVADEPTGNVDPDMAMRLLGLFEALNRLGTTVVVATHDIHLISRIENAQMMRLEKGRLSDPTGALRYPPGRS